MYAVIRTGGKQYRVSEGGWLDVEKLPVDEGKQVQFTDVLLVGDDKSATIGRPVVAGAVVTGTVLVQGRGKKIIIFKYKKRKNQRRKNGHRQSYTRVRIDSIQLGAARPAAPPKASTPPPPPPGA
jgi:large subunit ribosomal protein L21